MEHDYALYLQDSDRVSDGANPNTTSALLQGLLPAVAPSGLTASAERMAISTKIS